MKPRGTLVACVALLMITLRATQAVRLPSLRDDDMVPVDRKQCHLSTSKCGLGPLGPVWCAHAHMHSHQHTTHSRPRPTGTGAMPTTSAPGAHPQS